MSHPIGTRIALIAWPSAVAFILFGLWASIVAAAVLLAFVAWQDFHA